MEPTKPNSLPQPISPEPQSQAPEIPVATTIESIPATPVAPASSPNDVVQVAAVGPTPTPVSLPAATVQDAPQTTAPTPAVADDADVIEKEWVDAAEAMEKKTTGDPHAEEEGFENLQVDYIHKRFGKDIKKSEGS